MSGSRKNPSSVPSINPKLTRFPVTFYDYSPIKHDSIDSQRADATEGGMSYEFDGVARDMVAPMYFVNNNIGDAHKIIMRRPVSPYKAWSWVLGYKRRDLPYLLNMTPERTRWHLKNFNIEIPAENIKHFCDKTGVHPAYVIQTFSNENICYHYSVLKVIAQIAQDKTAPAYDVKIAIKALEIARHTFETFAKNPIYKMEAGNLLELAAMIKEYSLSDLNLKNIKMTFNDMAIDPSADIDFGSDILIGRMRENISHSFEEHFSKVDQLVLDRDDLSEGAEILFGESGKSDLEEIIGGMTDLHEDNLEVFRSLSWGFTNEGEIEGNSSDMDVYYSIVGPKLDPSYEQQAIEYGVSSGELLRDYLEKVCVYVIKFENLKNLTRKIEQASAEEDAFVKWEASSIARLWQIPMLENYLLARSVLGPGEKLDYEFAPQARETSIAISVAPK